MSRPASRLRLTGQPTDTDRDPRRLVELEGFAALENGATFRIKVLDLSYDGCKIEASVALLSGVHLKVAISGLGGSLDAAVRWCRDGKAGLRFYPEDADAPSAQHKPRIEQRVDLAASLSLRRFGRIQYDVRLFNISAAGCKVEFVERPQLGETVWVKFVGMDAIEAKVQWVDGFYGGLQFVRSIYPAVFDLLIAKLAK